MDSSNKDSIGGALLVLDPSHDIAMTPIAQVADDSVKPAGRDVRKSL
ncbi:MAG: hypothetical protein K8F93_11450 [Burkholderiales bacterium]|jgi:hypothetical protein|nr:hypothetical protein [Burkholderiales bacterium]MCL4690052.1 hypothetical protein [Burkholderiales bacterium]